MAELATLWSGPLTSLERACLLSFTRVGHAVTLYGFDRPELPDGIAWAPAAEILHPSYATRFITDGKPNIAHFADLFRLKLFERTGQTWIDADMLCLEMDASAWPSRILVEEGHGGIINCVLRIDLPAVVAEAEALTLKLLDRDLPWAATQNILPIALGKASPLTALDSPRLWCPIASDHWFALLLPEHRDACDRLCGDALTAHLYNNILQKVGFLKSALPPQGSWLRAALDARDLSGLFVGEYPAEAVRNLVDGWLLRFSAEAAGFGAIVRQAVPSLKRTLARRQHR